MDCGFGTQPKIRLQEAGLGTGWRDYGTMQARVWKTEAQAGKKHTMQIVTDKAAAAQQPFLTIKPPGLWSPFALGEVWSYRDLLWALAVRDVKLRYRQTALGIIWVVLQPLLAAGIMSFVFGSIA